jgi:hypothetical protein
MFYKITVGHEERTNATKYNYPSYDGEVAHKNLGSNVGNTLCIWESDRDIENGDTILEITAAEKENLLTTWQEEKDALNTEEPTA